MNTLSAVTLMMLEEEALDLPNLLERISDELLLPNDPELSNAVTAIVEQLVAVGLLEPVAA